MEAKKTGRFNLYFNIFILVGMLIAVLLTNIVKFRDPEVRVVMQILASVAALTGVINTVLSANGKILTFLFGVIDVALTAFIAWDSGIWGNFALHAFYFLPMQFIGFWQWSRRGAHADVAVEPRRLSGRQWGWLASAFLVGLVVVYLILARLDNDTAATAIRTLVLFDALVFVLNVLGQVLMSFAFMEQWYVWILVNIFSILLWFNKSASSPDSSYTIVIVIKYIFYFMNSLNGLRIWLSLSKRRLNQPETE